MYRFYADPTTLDEALALKAYHGEQARFIAGGTDLLIELDREARRAPDGGELGLIDLTRIPGLAEVTLVDGQIQLGPLVTHNQCVASPLIVEHAFPLARACWEVGAPQIRNRATVAGNLITASPANDAIVPLMALGATVTLAGTARGERTLPLASFYTGFRKVDLAPDEMLTRISFPPLGPHQEGTFIKLGLRRAQAISVVSVAAIVTWDAGRARVQAAAISLGAVAPVIVRAAAAEAFLAGQPLNDAVIAAAARLAVQAASPIDDVRADAEYRAAMVETLTARSLTRIRDGQARAGWIEQPVLLRGKTDGRWPVTQAKPDDPVAIVNGTATTLTPGMTLLDSLRRRRMRRMHRLSGRHGGHGLSGPRRTRRGLRSRYGGRAGQPHRAPCRAGGAGAERRRPVWLLHARLCHERGQAAGRTAPADPRRSRRGAHRQLLPLHRLSQNLGRGGGRGRTHRRTDAMTQTPDTRIKLGPVVQVGFVVRDAHATMDAWTSRFQVDPGRFIDWPPTPEAATTGTYHGGPGNFRMRLAFLELGSVQLEFIEPLEGDNIYYDFLAEHGEGLHHLLFEVDDPDAVAAGLGVKVMQSGSSTLFPGAFWSYLDTQDALAAIVELRTKKS